MEKFNIGDGVYHWKYGWGTVIDIVSCGTWACPVLVNFPDKENRPNVSTIQVYFTLDGRETKHDPPTLSFTEYWFANFYGISKK